MIVLGNRREFQNSILIHNSFLETEGLSNMRESIAVNDRVADFDEQIVEQLEHIFEPDLGLDVYNLGFIYGIDIDEAGDCEVTMTFSEMGCACSEDVPKAIRESLAKIDGIRQVTTKIVWEPVWQLSMISRVGRITLGINPKGRVR
jgi:metal-sulfur cluster biosynthetic enzyme